MTKTTPFQRDTIRRLYATGFFTQGDLADRYGISRASVNRYVRSVVFNTPEVLSAEEPNLPTLPGENWARWPKDGRYWCSSYGRIWSTVRSRLLNPSFSLGRLIVSLGIAHSGYPVGKAILETFIPPTRRGTIRFLDGNRKNTHLYNLTWHYYQTNDNHEPEHAHLGVEA